jgi:hydroxyacylglutathione hydrolase
MKRLKAERLEKLLEEGTPPVILDVRSAFEFRSGHIPGAIHAPLPAVGSSARRVVKEKSDPVVLVCEHGPRAQLARFILQMKGFKNLELLDGHMSLWRRSSRPTRSG